MRVDPGSARAADRVTLTMGALMAGALVLAAWEQWRDGFAWPHWLLPLSAACACAGWCLALVRRARNERRRSCWSLVIAPDGGVRLVNPSTAESVDAAVGMAWGLGGLIYLQVGPIRKVVCTRSGADAGQSSDAAATVVASGGPAADCRWLLARRDFSVADWHGLRRWLVWYRRSGHAVQGATGPA